jgi:excisionase family DNA binding protein
MSDLPAFRLITVSIKTASQLTGISRSKIYDAIGRGELDAVKDGERTLITVESLERRQAALPRAKIAPPKAKPSTAS